MGKKVKSAFKKLTIAGKLMDKLMGAQGSDPYKQQQELLKQQQEAARLAAQRAQADLSSGDKAVVLEGAAASDLAEGDALKKRKGVGSLSASLGLGGL